MNIFDMKKSDFDSIPFRKWNDPAIEFTDLVIIPTRYKHDSGYRCIKYCACINGEPVAMLGGHSDVMHLDGIGGYGKWDKEIPTKADVRAWKMDCLPCGYLHIWCSGYNLIADAGLSDFELFTKDKRK